MKSSGPTPKFSKNPYVAIVRDAVASPGEWQEIEIARHTSAATQAHAAASATMFTISQKDGILYMRYDGPAPKDTA